MVDAVLLELCVRKCLEALPQRDGEAQKSLTEVASAVYVAAERRCREQEMLLYARRLCEKGFFEGTSGNISCRLSDGSILITPSGCSKDLLKEEDLVRMDREGNRLSGFRKASSESKMHLEIYRRRSDVDAVVHTHSPFATAFAASEAALSGPLLAEAAVLLGPVPKVAYATPSTDEVPGFLRPYLDGHQAFLLANHGCLTLGSSLKQAAGRSETLELFARVSLYAKILGGGTVLSSSDLEKLYRSCH